jgi:hypothetical protein
MKRLHVILVVVLVLVLGCLSIAIFQTRQPCYQGRKLSEWIEYAKNTEPTDPKFQASSNAVKQMAPNAIPIFLKWLQVEDSPPKKKLIDWLGDHPSFHLQIKEANDYFGMAAEGIWLLGDEGKPILPVLIQWTYSPDANRRSRAFTCLLALQSDEATLVPVLLRLIHDPDKKVQRDASTWFHSLYPRDAEAAGVYKMFPDLIRNETPEQPATNQIRAK